MHTTSTITYVPVKTGKVCLKATNSPDITVPTAAESCTVKSVLF